jgi:hypothetical protein
MACLRAESVQLNGQSVRFCQKCSRFEPLCVFKVRCISTRSRRTDAL